MGVSITDGARNVVVEHNDLDQIALYASTSSPTAWSSTASRPAPSTSATRTTTSARTASSPILAPWLFAGTGKGPETDIEVEPQRLDGRPAAHRAPGTSTAPGARTSGSSGTGATPPSPAR